MEKFGIFELLDTLSALLPPEPSAPSAEKDPARPDPKDAAFAPPSYGEPPAKTPAPSSYALSSFMARHDAAAKKADGGLNGRKSP